MSAEVDISYTAAKRIYEWFMKCGWCYKTAIPLKAFMYVKSAIFGSICHLSLRPETVNDYYKEKTST